MTGEGPSTTSNRSNHDIMIGEEQLSTVLHFIVRVMSIALL